MHEKLEENDALVLERYYISLCGRKNIGTGRLLNLTPGGESNLSPKVIEYLKGPNNPMKIIRTNKGSFKKGHKPTITPERNELIRQSKIGIKNHNYKNIHAADHMQVTVSCENCGKILSKGNYSRWHGKKCKY